MNRSGAETDPLLEFVRRETAFNGPLRDTDSFDQIGLYGDDIQDFVESYATHFGVDLTDYRWYFHSSEEGWSLGRLVFTPPDRRVTRIPLTIGILRESAAAGRWCVDYPPHQPPDRRPDLLLDRIVVAALLLAAIAVSLALWL